MSDVIGELVSKVSDLITRVIKLESKTKYPTREYLGAARTYYVNPSTGSDTLYTGMSATVSGTEGPFLTIQKAVDVAQSVDFGAQTITIQLADGTYTLTASVDIRNFTGGAGLLNIIGNISTPANVAVGQSTSGLSAFVITDNSRMVTITGMRLGGTGSNAAAIQAARGKVAVGALEFNTGWSIHLFAYLQGQIRITSNYAVLSGGAYHWAAQWNSLIFTTGRTVTLTGTPAFTGAWAYSYGCSTIVCDAMTFSGGASAGTLRHDVQANSVIYTAGGGAAYLPGGVAGTPALGGQYI